jgi:hypothetical protein
MRRGGPWGDSFAGWWKEKQHFICGGDLLSLVLLTTRPVWFTRIQDCVDCLSHCSMQNCLRWTSYIRDIMPAGVSAGQDVVAANLV